LAYNKTLTINGWTPPNPKEGGFIISKEPIWSENTGRVASGLMVGDIIATKTTLEISWSKMTQADVNSLNNAIRSDSNPFFKVRYCNESGTIVTKSFYAAPNSYSRKRYTKGREDIIYSDVSIRLIER
jgi:hypothetical protein